MAREKTHDLSVKHGNAVSLVVLADVNKRLARQLYVDVAIEGHLDPRETFALKLIQLHALLDQGSKDEPT